MTRDELKNMFREVLAEENASAPAATVAPTVDGADFLKGAKVAKRGKHGKAAAAPAEPELRGPRPWTLTEKAVSQYGFPYYTFTAPTKNGGTVVRQVPADLADAIRAGKVRI